MTDSGTPGDPDWAPLIREVAHRTGHELRNALNGLMVNLEVVRAGSDGREPGVPMVATFVAQAVNQAEESARLADAALALLDLVLAAVDANGELRCESASAHSVRIAAADAQMDRALQRLSVLDAGAGVKFEAGDSAVIFTIRSKSSTDPD